MDFKNAVKALQIGKKEGKKFRLSTGFGKNPEEELPFRVRRCAGKTGQI